MKLLVSLAFLLTFAEVYCSFKLSEDAVASDELGETGLLFEGKVIRIDDVLKAALPRGAVDKELAEAWGISPGDEDNERDVENTTYANAEVEEDEGDDEDEEEMSSRDLRLMMGPISPSKQADRLFTWAFCEIWKRNIHDTRDVSFEGKLPTSGPDITIRMVNAKILRSGSIMRLGMASYGPGEQGYPQTLKATGSYCNFCLDGNFQMSIPAFRSAPAQSRTGRVIVCVAKLKCQTVIGLNANMEPKKVLASTPSAVGKELIYIDGISNSKYKDLFEQALTLALSEVLKDSCYRPLIEILEGTVFPLAG